MNEPTFKCAGPFLEQHSVADSLWLQAQHQHLIRVCCVFPFDHFPHRRSVISHYLLSVYSRLNWNIKHFNTVDIK